MPKVGVEPTRANAHYALNVARLPIPPLRLADDIVTRFKNLSSNWEGQVCASTTLLSTLMGALKFCRIVLWFEYFYTTGSLLISFISAHAIIGVIIKKS